MAAATAPISRGVWVLSTLGGSCWRQKGTISTERPGWSRGKGLGFTATTQGEPRAPRDSPSPRCSPGGCLSRKKVVRDQVSFPGWLQGSLLGLAPLRSVPRDQIKANSAQGKGSSSCLSLSLALSFSRPLGPMQNNISVAAEVTALSPLPLRGPLIPCPKPARHRVNCLWRVQALSGPQLSSQP